jgi:hypothetical protein
MRVVHFYYTYPIVMKWFIVEDKSAFYYNPFHNLFFICTVNKIERIFVI